MNQTRHDWHELSEGVDSVAALCAEFQRAIAALVADRLEDLEPAVMTQEKLAEKLRVWISRQSSRSLTGSESGSRSIPAEFAELAKVVKLYSSLLSRCMRTVNVRAALCQTCRHGYSNSSSSLGASTNWSCEV